MGWDTTPAAVVVGRDALAAVDLIITQGATNRVRFRLRDKPTGTPTDLTGWVGVAQLRASTAAADPWLTITTITTTNTGDVTLTIPYHATEGTDWDNRHDGVWDLELTSPTGTRERLAAGRVTVSHEVTRA